MDKKLYLVIFQVDADKTAILGSTQTSEQAFAIVRDFLSQNENIKTEQIFVEEYSYEKTLKILDYQE